MIHGNFRKTPKGMVSMTSNGNTVHSVAPWRAASAYLYALDLDGPALAWEYLRRHPGYRKQWLALGRGIDAERWGLRQRR